MQKKPSYALKQLSGFLPVGIYFAITFTRINFNPPIIRSEIMDFNNIKTLSKKLSFATILITATVAPMRASAGHGDLGSAQRMQKLVIETGGLLLKGYNVLPLKKMIREQNPYIYLKAKKLIKVIVVAKSKRGGGIMALVTGNKATSRKLVTGFSEDFANSKAYTFDRIRFKPAKYSSGFVESPNFQSYGQQNSYGGNQKWQVQTQGKIKVKKIILFISDK
jgi:hypothetical protein